MQTAAMIDSSATGLFINEDFVKKHNMTKQRLPEPIKLFNIDGSINTVGSITHLVRLLVTLENMEAQLLEFLVTNLGSENVILGMPWLKAVNPKVDWVKGTIELPGKSPIFRLNGNHQWSIWFC